MMTPGFAGMRIREVDLDLHAREGRERVGERVCVVRERAGIEDDRSTPAARSLNRVDEDALMVRLQVLDIVAAFRRGLGRDRDKLRKGRRAVLVGFALAEQIEIRSGQQQY